MSCTFPEWATTPSIWELVLTIRFPLFFAALALSIGSASFLNGKLVMHTGIRWMASRAAVAVGGLSLLFGIAATLWAGVPPLWSLMLYLTGTLFCIGILFGNLNALAM